MICMFIGLITKTNLIMKSLPTALAAISGSFFSVALSLLIMLICANTASSQTVFEDWVQTHGTQSYFLKV